MIVDLDTSSIESYRKFLAIKRLPSYRIVGRTAHVPDEYAHMIGVADTIGSSADYVPSSFLFDYQQSIAAMAISKRKFSIFADCGLGKTLMMLEYIQHVRREIPSSKKILIVSPLMVVRQTLAEADRFYGDSLPISLLRSASLNDWLTGTEGNQVGIVNYDALSEDTPKGNLGALVLDESSMLKSHYGHWGSQCLRLGEGLDWKLCLTGTPAPNDRIEYANHAVFMDAYPNVNSFLGRFFVNKGQTAERWCLRGHALQPFYVALSHWCIFLTNPATYGWSKNSDPLPPINVHIHDVELTDEQLQIAGKESGMLFAADLGGITSRATMGALAKGRHKGQRIATNKNRFIRELVESWPDESTIIWCIYNDEQEQIAEQFPGAANITGSTPIEERLRLIDEFKRGERKVLISKPKILGFGLNLQIATRQVFSGLQDSYESYYQAVKRSNRYGATLPLNVHIPVTDLELPMVENVLRKASNVQRDTEEQERIFRDCNQLAKGN